MTTDLDDRLTDLLARAGAAVEVRPDAEAVLAEDAGPAPIVDLRDHPRRTRRRLALAAAVLVAVGVVGAATTIATRDDRPVDVAAPSTTTAGERRFPVLGHLPAELADARIDANDGAGVVQTALGSVFTPGTDVVRTAYGLVTEDGTIASIVQVAAAAESVEDGAAPPPPGDVEDLGDGYRVMILGQESWLYGPGITVAAVGGPAAGELVRALADEHRTTGAAPAALLSVVPPPSGLTLLAPPATLGAQAETVARAADGSMLTVETGVGRPELAIMSAGGTARPVTIGDGEGLVAPQTGLTRVAWTDPSGVDVSLVTELGEEEALAVARGVELVDEATWRATYPERPADELPQVPASITTHPLVGQPAPELAGVEGGRWTVVSLTASWCVPCLAQLDVLGPVQDLLQEEDRARIVSVFVEDTPEAVDALIAEKGIDWPTVRATEEQLVAWGPYGLPMTVFVDADGIVRGVVEGEISGRQIDETLAGLGE